MDTHGTIASICEFKNAKSTKINSMKIKAYTVWWHDYIEYTVEVSWMQVSNNSHTISSRYYIHHRYIIGTVYIQYASQYITVRHSTSQYVTVRHSTSQYTSQILLKPDIAGIPSMPEHWVGLHWIVRGKPAPATEVYCMASALCLWYLRHVTE